MTPRHLLTPIALGLTLAACASPPELRDPTISLHLAHRAGNVIGTTAAPDRLERDGAWTIGVRAFVVPTADVTNVLTGLERNVSSIFDPSTPAPLHAVPSELAPWSIAAADAAASLERVVADRPTADAATGVLFDGTRLEVRATTGLDATPRFVVARTDDALRLAVRAGSEICVVGDDAGHGDSNWLAYDFGDGRSLLCEWTRAADVPAPEEVVNVARGQIERAAAAVEPSERWLERDRLELALAIAWSGLTSEEHARDTLFALATSDGPSLTRDVAAVLDDDAVRTLARAAHRSTDLSGHEPSEWSWLLERAVIHRIADRVDCDECTAAEPGLLLRHFGEFGRFAGDIARFAAAAPDAATFRERVLRENHLALRSSDPAARVRAFDWLAFRGAAPAGFDPLASREDRRDALREVQP